MMHEFSSSVNMVNKAVAKVKTIGDRLPLTRAISLPCDLNIIFHLHSSCKRNRFVEKIALSVLKECRFV